MLTDRRLAGLDRYRQDLQAGRVGKTVHSRSGLDLPPHRPKTIFMRHEQIIRTLRRQGCSFRQIARSMKVGLGSVSRALREVRKDRDA